MKKENLTLRQKIEELIKDQSVSNYRISKDTGISLSSVQDLRKGVTPVGNLTLRNSEKYANFYDELVKN